MYRVEVFVEGEWVGNALTFPSEVEAEQYAHDLASRWTAVRDWRVYPMEVDK